VAESLRAPRKSCRPTWTRPHGWQPPGPTGARRAWWSAGCGMAPWPPPAARRATLD